jgi:O-antigen/teichoic acid export membrane protein
MLNMSKLTNEYNLNKDILSYLPVKFLPAISGLFTIYLLTRTLSTSLYSDYVFIMATILLFGQLITGWISSSVIFFYSDYENNNTLNVFKINVIGLQLLLFAVGSFGFALASYFGLNDFLLVFLGLFLLLSQTFLNLLYSFLQAERRILVQMKSTALQSLVQLIGILYCFLYQNENLYIIISVLLLSYFIASNYVMYFDNSYSLIFSRKNIKLFDFSISKKILSYGLPVCVWFFASQFYVIGDRILFQYFNIKNLVGNYASFRDLSVGLSGFITMPLLMASHPIIMQMSKNSESKKQIETILSQNIKLLITLFTSVFIGIFLIGRSVLTFIVGEKYLLDNNLMFLVMLSILFGTIAMYLHKGLETTGKTILMAKIALTVAALSFIFNFLLLPIYGVKVACVIALVSQLVYCVLVYKFSKGVFKIEISYKFLLKNIFFVVLAFVFSNFLFEINSFIFFRLLVFLVLMSYLLISSKEIKILVNTNNN